MTELMKRYLKETGESIQIRGTLMGRNYVAWLETKVLDEKTIEKFQEIIRNQCDEISALKDQLRWRPVSEKPKKADMYFAEVNPYTGCDFTIITTAYFDGERFLWHDVVKWLLIPPQGE